MKYRIWERFSPEARRAAVAAAYENRGTQGGPVTTDGCCPLGVALIADRVENCGEVWWSAPTAEDVADALPIELDRPEEAYEASRQIIYDEACAFIAAWDGKRIDPADLPALLEIDDALGTGRGDRGAPEGETR